MNDLSLHILDIVENSTRANAANVWIDIVEDSLQNRLSFRITDDGKGMTAEVASRVLDPFYSSKKERARGIGLGLPLLRSTCEQCGGSVTIHTEPGKGTDLLFDMELDNIDRPPLGDLNETLQVLIMGHPAVDFHFRYTCDGEEEFFSTRSDAEETDITKDRATVYDITIITGRHRPEIRLRGECNGNDNGKSLGEIRGYDNFKNRWKRCICQ